MKAKILFSFAAMAGALLSLSSCATEAIDGINANGVPNIENYKLVVTEDQSTNAWTAEITDVNGNPATGIIGFWDVYSNGADQSPVNMSGVTAKGIILSDGDFPIEVKIRNHNGAAQGVLKGNIHMNESRIDMSPYINILSGTWRMKHEVKGHIGCGSPGSNGLDWWSANTDEKAGFGMYENRVSFTPTDAKKGVGAYAFDGGESGTIYMNKDFTEPPYGSAGHAEDYTAPVQNYTSTFQLKVSGNDLTLQLGAEAFLPYIPNAETFYNPIFTVNAISAEALELTCDNGNIAWHYILCPEGWQDPSAIVIPGFNYNDASNLWKDCEITPSFWFANDGWGEIDSPLKASDIKNDGFSFVCPEGMGGSQWQGQVHLATNIEVSAADTYDFCIYIKSDADTEVTVKVQKDGDDNTFFVAEKQKFTAGGSAYTFEDMAGFDGMLQLCLDFGGNAGKTFSVSNINFRKHVAE